MLVLSALSITACRGRSYGERPYNVIVIGGTGSGYYLQYDTVTITAEVPAGYSFINWTTTNTGVRFADPNAITTTFVKPINAVTVTANFEPNPPGPNPPEPNPPQPDPPTPTGSPTFAWVSGNTLTINADSGGSFTTATKSGTLTTNGNPISFAAATLAAGTHYTISNSTGVTVALTTSGTNLTVTVSGTVASAGTVDVTLLAAAFSGSTAPSSLPALSITVTKAPSPTFAWNAGASNDVGYNTTTGEIATTAKIGTLTPSDSASAQGFAASTLVEYTHYTVFAGGNPTISVTTSGTTVTVTISGNLSPIGDHPVNIELLPAAFGSGTKPASIPNLVFMIRN